MKELSEKIIFEKLGIIFDVSWHPSGNYLAVVGSDCKLDILFCNDDLDFVHKFTHKFDKTARRVEWNSKGDYFTVSCFDNVVYVFKFVEETDDEEISINAEIAGYLNEHEGQVKAARWSHDDKYIVSCSRDKTIWIWEKEEMDFSSIHKEHTEDVKDVMFAPDDSVIVSVSFDSTTKIWDPHQELGSLQSFTNNSGTVWSIAFNEDNCDFVTGGEDGKLTLYRRQDDKTYKIHSHLQLLKNLQSIYCIEYLGDGYLVSGATGSLFLIDLGLNKVIKEINTSHIGDINCVRLCPKNNDVAAFCNDDGTVSIINI